MKKSKEAIDSFGKDKLDRTAEKDMEDIRGNLKIFKNTHFTYVVIVAINKNAECNQIQQIGPCKGESINACVYNDVKASYEMICTASQSLGIIRIAYSLGDENNSWGSLVPMPESVLKRHLSSANKSLLKAFKAAYPEDKYIYDFLQFVFN